MGRAISVRHVLAALAGAVVGTVLPLALLCWASVGGVVLAVADFQLAPVREVSVDHVSWFRYVHYDVKQERKLLVPCTDGRGDRCTEVQVDWSSDGIASYGRGTGREWPDPPAPPCDQAQQRTCSVRTGSEDYQYVVLEGPLGAQRCFVDEQTWLRAANDGRVLVRKSHVLGVLRCDSVSAVERR